MTEITIKKERPKHLDLRVIKQPLPAIASILHRVSGAGLFLMLPFLIFLLDLSLDSSLGFAMFKAFVSYPLVKLLLIGLLWAFLHHFCMGIRILLLDLDILFWTGIVFLQRLERVQPDEQDLFVGPISNLFRRYLNWFALDTLVTLVAMGLTFAWAGVGFLRGLA